MKDTIAKICTTFLQITIISVLSNFAYAQVYQHTSFANPIGHLINPEIQTISQSTNKAAQAAVSKRMIFEGNMNDIDKRSGLPLHWISPGSVGCESKCVTNRTTGWNDKTSFQISTKSNVNYDKEVLLVAK